MRKSKSTNQKVAGVNRPILIVLLAILSLIYGIWRTFFTIPTTSGWLAFIIGSALVASECTTIFGAIIHFVNAARVKLPTMPKIDHLDYPQVDIFVPTFDESTDVIYKTLNGCKKLNYPDKTKIKIYLCDDGDRDEMKQLAQEFKVKYLHAPDNENAKAGNLNYAIHRTHAPYIVIFDADMIPRQNFLLETIPYFSIKDYLFEDGQWRKRADDEPCNERPISFIQTRQSFYNKDIFQHNLHLDNKVPNEQDYFHREVNVARLNMNAVMFAGSNAVISRESFEDVGGFPTISITEDLALSIELWDHGYQGIALDKTLAHGMAPETAEGLIKQRSRWSRGAAQCVVRFSFLFKKMSLISKLGFFMAYAHWWTYVRRMIFIIAPIAYGVFGIQIAHIQVRQLIFIFIPYLLIYNYSLKKMSRERLSAFYSALTDTILFPFMIWPIVAGSLKIPKTKFEVTPKENINKRNSRLIYTVPFLILIVLYILTILNCLNQFIFQAENGALPVLYWSFYNILTLILAVVFYFGKHITKIDLMLKVNQKVQIDDQVYETAKMGDDIFSIENIHESNFANDSLLKGKILDYDSKIDFETRKYAYDSHNEEMFFEIKSWDNVNKSNYLEMLYDRPITLPHKVRLNYFHGVTILCKRVINKFITLIVNKKREYFEA